MREYKEAVETIARSPKGVRRLGKLSWWFIALLLIGSALAIYVFVRELKPAAVEFQKIGFFVITNAFAQTQPMPAGPFDPKPIVMMAIILTLLIVLLGSVWTMLRSSNAGAIQAAGDLTKVLVGFFVGVATKYLGA